MTVRHPLADRGASPAAVTVGTTTYEIGDDGTIACPSDDEAAVADVLADAYDVSAASLRETTGCDVIKADGEVCGRALPCQYHD